MPTIGRAFSPVYHRTRSEFVSATRRRWSFCPLLQESTNDNDTTNDDTLLGTSQKIWNPSLRRVVGGMASIGILETSYLTYTKLATGISALCGTDGSCSSVLSGPYSVIPTTNIPLSGLGLLGYVTVASLAFWPLMSNNWKEDVEDDDTQNRILLTAGVTALGTFSIFLMSILFGVLHESCIFCVTSATLSIGMMALVWLGGALPDDNNINNNNRNPKLGRLISAGSFVATSLVAMALFLTAADGDSPANTTQFGASASSMTDSTLLASNNEGFSPPPITTASSERALALSSQLQALDTKMYGAYWCSHCYDQKQTLGKEAFSKITYIECSKDGKNSESGLCRKRDVPGYPTWQINGKLYPGEQAIEELEEIVSNAINNK